MFAKITTCVELKVEQIFSVNIQYKYFCNFGCGFCGSFPMLFSKAPISCGKNNLK